MKDSLVAVTALYNHIVVILPFPVNYLLALKPQILQGIANWMPIDLPVVRWNRDVRIYNTDTKECITDVCTHMQIKHNTSTYIYT